MVDVDAVQAGKRGLLRLKVVLKWNPITGRGAPEGEVKLALPPAEGSVLPDLPCLVGHCNVSSERRVLIVGKDVREHGLKLTPFIVDHYFLVGQREDVGLVFEMAAWPIFCLAIERKRLCAHAVQSCMWHWPMFKMVSRSISPGPFQRGWRLLFVSWRTITSGTISVAPDVSQMSTSLCWYQMGITTLANWTKRSLRPLV